MTWNPDAHELKPYQKEDVEIMKKLEIDKRFRGGINANGMGLGKTGIFHIFFVAVFFFVFFFDC